MEVTEFSAFIPRTPEASLVRAIDDHLILGHTTPESRVRRTSRIALQIFSIAYITFAQVAFIPPNLKFGRRFLPFGILLASSECLGFLALNSWTILDLIRDATETLSPEEATLLRSQINPYARALIFTVAIAAALFSQISVAYIAARYNPRFPFFALVDDISEAPFPARSFQLLLQASLLKILSWINRRATLQQGRTRLVTQAEQTLEHFQALPPSERASELATFHVLQEIPDREARVQQFTALMAPDLPLTAPQITSHTLRIAQTTVKVVAVALTAFYLLMIGCLSEAGAAYLIHNKFGTIAIAIGVTVCYLYLTGRSILDSSLRTFNTLTHLRHPQLSLAQQLRPRLTFSLQAIALTAASFSWGTTAQAVHDTVPGPFGTLIEITSSIALVILIQTAMIDLVNQFVESIIIFRGTPQERATLQFTRMTTRYIRYLKEAPDTHLRPLLTSLPTA